MQQNKDYSISFLRMVAMFFVVMCHFFQYYGNELAWWFNVGVQVFFCVSGFLYGSRKDTISLDFVTRNFKKILIPYFVFLVPVIVIYFCFARDSISVTIALKAVLCSATIDGIGNLWFVSYILFCYLITPYLCLFSQKICKLKPVYSILAVGGVSFLGQVLTLAYNVYFSFAQIFCYIVGYFMAVYLENENRKTTRVSAIICIASIAVNGIRVYCKYVAMVTFPFWNAFEAYAHDLLAISMFLACYTFLGPLNKNRLLDASDKYSYYIYLVHQLFILSPFSLMDITRYKYFNWAMVIIATLLAAMVLKFISDRVTLLINEKMSVLRKCAYNKEHKII